MNGFFEFLNLRGKDRPAPSAKQLNRGDRFIRPRKIGAVRNIPVIGPTMRAILPASIRKLAWQRDVLPGRFHFTAQEEAALIAAMRPDLDRLRDEYQVDIARWWGL